MGCLESEREQRPDIKGVGYSGLSGGRSQQGHIMTCDTPRHLAFVAPFFHKKILKIILYDCVGIKTNMLAGFYAFFYFKRN